MRHDIRLALGSAALIAACPATALAGEVSPKVVSPTAIELSSMAEITYNSTTGAISTYVVRRLFGPNFTVVPTGVKSGTVSIVTPTLLGSALVTANLSDAGHDPVTYGSTTVDSTVVKGLVTASTDPRFKVGLAVVEVHAYSNNFGLNYTEFGFWSMKQRPKAAVPALVGTFAGPSPGISFKSTMPTSGSAKYSGGAIGVVSSGGTAGLWEGKLALAANFSATGGTISGAITGINVVNAQTDAAVGTVNDLELGTASFTKRFFSGAVTAGSNTGTFANLAAGKGVWGGGFYGPSAAEVAGILRFSTGTTNVLGSFAGKQ